MRRSAWEAPDHTGLQPAALRSLEHGALGRGEAPARARSRGGGTRSWVVSLGQQQGRVGSLVLCHGNRSWELR